MDCFWDVLPILTVLFLALCYLYKKLTKNHDYWKRQNISFVKPFPFLGSMRLETMKKPLHETETDWYNEYGRVYGRYEGGSPVLSVGDPDLLKKILVKDFNIFQHRRDLKFHDAIMDNTLFVLEGEAWKRVRNIVTPTFTTSKLKRMMPLLSECCDMLLERLSETSKKSESVNCQTFFEGFVICAIGRCAFGMSIGALQNPDNEFIRKAKVLFDEFLSWRTVMTILCPGLMRLLRINLLNPETTNFYRNIITEVLEERTKLNVVQDDFLQMLLDAKNSLEDSNNNVQENVCEKGNCNSIQNFKPTYKGLSHDEMLAQCITFFIAGFDPTTSLLSHVVYQLAVNPHYQEKVVEEMNAALDNHDGVICYEALSEMKFTDAVLNECLRLCPAMVRSERRTEEEYFMEEQKILLKKGMLVSIPVYAIHHDPEWYPDPEVFRPERFSEPSPLRPQYVHLPFGAGPRVCVGTRFVQMQVKLCLTKVLQKFEICPTPTTPDKLGYIECRNVLKVDKVDVHLKERSSN